MAEPPAVAGATAPGSLLRTTWALAWPAILSYAIESVTGLCDMLMMGRLGPAAVAAVGVGVQIFSAVNAVLFAVGTGTLAIVARHVGARERAAAEEVLLHSMATAVALAVAAIVPVLVWTEACVRVFGVTPEVAGLAATFVRYVLLAVPGAAVVFVVAVSLRGAGDMRTPLLIGAVVGVVNVVTALVLVFGLLGMPALGAAGAGIATATAFTAGAALGTALLARGRLPLGLPHRPARLRPAVVRRVLRIGLPSALEHLLMQLGFFLYIGFVARYGTGAVAAYFIGARVLSLSFLPGLGFAAAAATLVGQGLGARRPQDASRSAHAALRLCVGLMSGAGLVLFATAHPVARLFVDDPHVVADTVAFIRVLAVCQPLMAVDFTLGGALRGAGDTRSPLLSVLLGFYAGRLLAAALLTFWLHAPLEWLWLVVLLDFGGRAGFKAWRFRSNRWASVRV